MLMAALATGFAQPVITCQPRSQTNIVGATVTLSVCATGAPPLAYQWRRGGANVAGETNASLVFTNLQPVHAGNYTVVITNIEGAITSTVAFVRVIVPPSITAQPTNFLTLSLGASASNKVMASGTALFYQWRLNGTDVPSQTNALIVLTNLQLSDVGDYTVVITNAGGSTNSRVARLDVDPTFTKITTGPIVEDLAGSVRGSWGDYDDDGYLDLFVTSPAANKNHLYHNERDGTFSCVTTGDIVNTARDWRTGAWADYDNDGHLDLYVTGNSAYAGARPFNDLYRNHADGTFTAMSSNVVGSIAVPNGDSETCAWADYDRDGFLDLFVARYGDDLLFHNNGDDSFVRVTNSVAVRDGRNNYGCAWGDYDNDGWPDLFSSSINSGGNFLYHNRRDGTFERITSGPPGQDAPSFGVSVAWADYNNDGFEDLFVTNGDGADLFYRNEGDGTFTRITTGELVNPVGAFHNCAWGDYDNDGYLDVFLAVRYGRDNLLYRNNGDGNFARVTTGSLVRDLGNSVNGVWGDFDNDGFLDLFVANGAADAPERNFFYRNNGNTNSWLKCRLIGTTSNRPAIGAKVRLKATVRGREMWQLREIFVNSGNSAGSGLIAHFGLGDASRADVVRIEWPSGTVQALHDVRTNQFLTVVEPPRLSALEGSMNAAFQTQLTCWPAFDFAIETSTNLIDWTPWTTVTTTNRITRIDDPAGRTLSQRSYRAAQP